MHSSQDFRHSFVHDFLPYILHAMHSLKKRSISPFGNAFNMTFRQKRRCFANIGGKEERRSFNFQYGGLNWDSSSHQPLGY